MLGEITLFILGTITLVAVSRKSLANIRSHGFYRFFAWETLLGMFMLNVGGWFRDPFAWYQLISWFLLIVSLVLVIQGVRLLREVGKQDKDRDNPSLFEMEKTSHLVTTGLYHYIRHPLYSSLLFLGWGMFFKSPSWLDAELVALLTLLLTITARIEEHENITYFGDIYLDYMKRTRLFIPYVF